MKRRSTEDNFNVTALVDGSDSTVFERYVYDPYGNVTMYNEALSTTHSSSDVEQTIGWTAKPLPLAERLRVTPCLSPRSPGESMGILVME